MFVGQPRLHRLYQKFSSPIYWAYFFYEMAGLWQLILPQGSLWLPTPFVRFTIDQMLLYPGMGWEEVASRWLEGWKWAALFKEFQPSSEKIEKLLLERLERHLGKTLRETRLAKTYSVRIANRHENWQLTRESLFGMGTLEGWSSIWKQCIL